MKKMATGSLIAGGILGAAGLAWAIADQGTKRRIMRDGTKAMKKATKMMDIH